MALRGVQKRKPAEVQKSGPALTITADDIGYRELLVRVRTKIILEHAQCICRFRTDGLGQRRGTESTYGRFGHVTASRSGGEIFDRVVEMALESRQKIIRIPALLHCRPSRW